MVITGDNLYNRREKLQLNCSSQGGPVLEYTWLHSGRIIDNATASTLVIDDVSTTDGGDYTCNVTNNAGYQSNKITVYSKLLLLYGVGLKYSRQPDIVQISEYVCAILLVCSKMCTIFYF